MQVAFSNIHSGVGRDRMSSARSSDVYRYGHLKGLIVV